LKAYIKKTPAQFKAWWNRMLFTGKGVAPKSFTTDDALLDFISKNNGFLGYVSGNAIPNTIKVISITD
jgi:hypothetical protein